MQQGRHYKIAKSLILDGTIQTFRDIFEYVPKTQVAKDFRMHFNTLNNRIQNSGKLSVEELSKLADLMGVDAVAIIKLAYLQYESDRKLKKKR